MTDQEAKFTLSAYRPGGQDETDAVFGEALRRAAADPRLGAWFALSRAHDAAISARLEEIEPPRNLRDSILAGARASRARPARRLGLALLAAAAIIGALSLSILWRAERHGTGVDAFGAFAIADVVRGHRPGDGEAKTALEHWLESADARLASAAIPVDFERLRDTGCRTLRFDGHEVLEICFERGGRRFHIYVARREDLPGMPASGKPTFVERAGGAAAIWSGDRFDFAVVSTGGLQALQRIL